MELTKEQRNKIEDYVLSHLDSYDVSLESIPIGGNLVAFVFGDIKDFLEVSIMDTETGDDIAWEGRGEFEKELRKDCEEHLIESEKEARDIEQTERYLDDWLKREGNFG